MLTVPCIVAALAWNSRAAVGYAVAVSGLVGASAATAGATRDYVVVWVGNMVFCLVAVTIVRIAVRTAERLDETLADSLQASAETAATTARAAARHAFADLMHDWVLATLLAAQRGRDSMGLQRQARLTLERLDSGWAQQRDTCLATEAVVSISATSPT